MPRPRRTANTAILEGARRAIDRLGPARVTLAAVAREVGLAPATLLQRFGTKRALFLAVLDDGVRLVDARFAAAHAAHTSPLAALIAIASDPGPGSPSPAPESIGNRIAFQHLDLSDREVQRLALDTSTRATTGYRALIEGAIEAGEIRPCDPEALAFGIHALAAGSAARWTIHREGALRTWLRRDLLTLLTPYRTDQPTVTLADRPLPLAREAEPSNVSPLPPEGRAAPRARHARGAPRPARPADPSPRTR